MPTERQKTMEHDDKQVNTKNTSQMNAKTADDVCRSVRVARRPHIWLCSAEILFKSCVLHSFSPWILFGLSGPSLDGCECVRVCVHVVDVVGSESAQYTRPVDDLLKLRRFDKLSEYSNEFIINMFWSSSDVRAACDGMTHTRAQKATIRLIRARRPERAKSSPERAQPCLLIFRHRCVQQTP